MYKLLAVVLTLALSVACNDSPLRPSNAPSPPPAPEEILFLWVTLSSDPSDARHLIAGLTAVIVDASQSTGPGPLAFAIDFGDGTRVRSAKARHVYLHPGTASITVEATDSYGRRSSMLLQVPIKAPGDD